MGMSRYRVVSLVLLLVSALLQLSLEHKPPCERYADTNGEWKSVDDLKKNPLEMAEVESHFFGGGPGTALEYSKIWVPNGCSYHRFTQHTLRKCAAYLGKQKNLTNNQFHMAFIGDSATRGIVCGLSRLLNGDEIYGPLDNAVCGGPTFGNPASTSKLNQAIQVDFIDKIKVTFTYVKTFHLRHMDWSLEYSITALKPYVVVMNTGAWDFDAVARSHPNQTAAETCSTNETIGISEYRADSFVNFTVHEMSKMSREFWSSPPVDVRLIYRNNHHNVRFGTICADEKFEKLLEGTNWELWDNRIISKDVWWTQCWDGFHFDRHKVHSYDHHKDIRETAISNKIEMPGMLEMQLVHSLLNSICYDSLHHIRETHVPVPAPAPVAAVTTLLSSNATAASSSSSGSSSNNNSTSKNQNLGSNNSNSSTNSSSTKNSNTTVLSGGISNSSSSSISISGSTTNNSSSLPAVGTAASSTTTAKRGLRM